MIDYHTHSGFSYDNGPVLMDEMIRRAIAAGVTGLAITDHYDPLFPNGPAELDFPRYMDELARVKETYQGEIRVAAGIELGMQPGRALELCFRAAESWPFDFIIGSVHAVDGYGLHTMAYARSRSLLEAKLDYYRDLLACVKEFDNFDVLGHLNVVDRYTTPIEQNDDVDALVDEILTTLISRGQGIEVNTSPLRTGKRDPMPPAARIKRFAELGGTVITTASDAHDPRHIGRHIKEAEELIRSAGLEVAKGFRGRKAVL
ncbi:MAG: histidinol-phosphatase HisJ family protein [Clostridiales Family XIII bacterium]|jgi:histidinol-phosphatase (PHP family)|nr:histidinol-phosphatase HisJ family protein [Clostridiales Family XIII bacterium]